MRIEDTSKHSRDCDTSDVTSDEPSESHRNFRSNFSIGGPYSAFSGIVSPGPGNTPVQHEQFYKNHFLPATTLYGDRLGISPEMPIAPAFAQIFQRRRRRENRPRRQRTTFNSEQTLKLELEYNRADYITRPRRFELAEMLTLTESQIKIWFQNRRAKDKRIEKAHMDHQFRTMGFPTMQGAIPLPISYQNMCGTCAVPPLSLPAPMPPILYGSTPGKTVTLI